MFRLEVTESNSGLQRLKVLNVPIIWFFEHFPLLRNVQIVRYLKVTLAYRSFNC